MGKKLGFIHRVDGVLAFGFNHNPIFYDKIGAKATIKFYSFVD